MHNLTLKSLEVRTRVNALIGNPDAPTPNTTENVSRDRLLRVQAGLRHVLVEVIPQIDDEQQREEISHWIDGIYTIICCEECESLSANKEGDQP